MWHEQFIRHQRPCRQRAGLSGEIGVVIANVCATLARPHEGLMCEKRGKEPTVYRVIANSDRN